MKGLLIVSLLSFFVITTGCSTTKVESKQGEFFTLNQRNVIYRDLTRPVGINNEPTAHVYNAFPEELK